MKKVLVIICLMLLALPVFAEYKPIPANRSAEYKAEIESIIDTEYPNAIRKVDEYVSEAKDLYNKIMKYGYYSNNQMDVINLGLIYEVCIPSADIDLYAKLIKVTKEKYLSEKDIPIGTDNTGSLEDFLWQYFKDNNVNTKKLSDIAEYANKQNKVIEMYVQNAEKLRPATD